MVMSHVSASLSAPTFDNLDLEISFSTCRMMNDAGTSSEYSGHDKVMRSRSRSQDQKSVPVDMPLTERQCCSNYGAVSSSSSIIIKHGQEIATVP